MPEPPTSTLSRTRPLDRQPSGFSNGGSPLPPRPRLKKLRLALILLGLSLLALVSTVFGMLMAVASDLPALENRAEFRAAKNSRLLAANNSLIAQLTGNNNRILLTEPEISQNIQNAVVAIEDRRFYQHGGVDYQGIGRAFLQDLLRQNAAQGGSTITEQFVKNALSAQRRRSVFQKLREAALAYHLERQWSKQKILTEYLNTVYFGNGAYGVESAVRTYFGGASEEQQSAAVGRHSASDVTPAQAALLAGIIASPTLYDPVEHPRLAKRRRDLVLRRMLDQRMISRQDYDHAVVTVLPTEREVTPPRPDSQQPYFSSWLTQQLVDRYRPGVVFGGGLKVRTTLDPDLQAAAEHAIAGHLAGVGPTASLVAIDNKTGEIRAMVGGPDFARTPFNLATNGHRQPGSSFKPFTLIAALEQGVSPDAVFTSRPKVFPVPGSPHEKFVVHNYEDDYVGSASLRTATARSDNSVFAELGLRVGTRKIAGVAQKMGIRTEVSTNPAMTLGGLKRGLTPLELAYAYSTIANGGLKVSGSLAPGGEGPVAIENVKGSGIDDKNEKRTERAFPKPVAETAQQLLAGVITSGTGKAAAIGEPAAGKTGTTENYGDAWFVGFNKDLTVAVWVGYPNKLLPMKTEFHGGPVAGGTFPAEIWHDLMTAWIGIRDERDAASGKDQQPTLTGPTAPVVPQVQPPPTQTGQGNGGQKAAPAEPAPQQKKPTQPAPTPAPAPEGGQPPPSGGAGGGAQQPSG
jgi:penicillin-binding protein 1A